MSHEVGTVFSYLSLCRIGPKAGIISLILEAQGKLLKSPESMVKGLEVEKQLIVM